MTNKKSAIRIIGGTWRSRKIIFAGEKTLRPTHNRIRETVFNWLRDHIENSECLDAFAGSGALGLEALSRGAKHVTLIDTSTDVIRDLTDNIKIFKTHQAEIIQCDFMLENTIKNKKFDTVFLDPPYQKKYLIRACELLLSRELLKPNALIYFECEKNSLDLSALPKNFTIIKQAHTQTIAYGLLQLKK